MPEVTLTMSQVLEGDITPLDHLLTHPCVQSADADIVEEGKLYMNTHTVKFQNFQKLEK